MSYYNNSYSSETIDDMGVDLSYVEKDSSYELVPVGDYLTEAVEVKITRSKLGNRMLNAQFRIVSGQYENRRIFETYNIEHANTKVCEIALRQIKSWVLAVGLTGNERLTMDLLNSLCGREFIASVKIEEDKTGQYEPKNRIRAYKPQMRQNGSNHVTAAPAAYVQQQQTPPPVTPHQQRAAAASPRPWEVNKKEAESDMPF